MVTEINVNNNITKKELIESINGLKKSEIHIDITLSCPHAPTKITQKDCRCRKPNSGMLEYIIKNLLNVRDR